MSHHSRRTVMFGAAGLLSSALLPWRARAQEAAQQLDPDQIYGTVEGEPFPVRAVNLSRINDRFLRSVVEVDSTVPPGTIVIDPEEHYLYLVDADGKTAMRYGVGVGRQGFAWSGDARIQAKREWPDWYPPKEMFARQPEIMHSMSQLQSGLGMAGGPGNPLGARAMYLYQGNKDTLYRIHGTIEPWTIGTSVSSGCIRMINQDVIDLYGRVPVGTNVVVMGPERPGQTSSRSQMDAEQ